MNILLLLKEKIDQLSGGEHEIGFQSILNHIEVAIKHMERGHNDPDDSAFTDAIYRTNQAFEGAIKEAYRVLAEKNPDKETISKIEEFLLSQDIFKPRVLSQFTAYRQEWRNPSTHDYKLSFNDSESFVAIVNVITFACILCDEVLSKKIFNKTKTTVKNSKMKSSEDNSTLTFIEQLSDDLIGFSLFKQEFYDDLLHGFLLEQNIVNEFAGFISAFNVEYNVLIDKELNDGMRYRADLVIERDKEMAVVEFKRFKNFNKNDAVQQVTKYLEVSEANIGIVYVWSDEPKEYKISKEIAKDGHSEILIFEPK